MNNDRRLYGLDLFSGIGGNTLGLKDYIKTIAYCEADRHAQSVLLSRMGDGSIETAPIWDDVTTLKREQFNVPIDIICGGFPCQDISVAGKGEGIMDGNRSGLFYEIIRLAEEIKPTFLFLENVPAIRTRGLDTVIQELTEIGYDCRWTMLSASDVGAHHKRERWFLLAYTQGSLNRGELRDVFNSYEEITRSKEQYKNSSGESSAAGTELPVLAHSNSARLQEARPKQQAAGVIKYREEWPVEPSVGRMVDGFPLRVDRLKRLGNAVVPIQAKTAFETLIGII